MIVLHDFYSLDCSYYNEEFDLIDELIDDIASSGMDPNYEITRNGINPDKWIKMLNELENKENE